ncbi:MAG: VOC family protein [Dehalococcoidia bacterium]
MQTHVSHLQFNVQQANIPFYADLLGYLGWQVIFDGEVPAPVNLHMLGIADTQGTSLWFVGQVKPVDNDYDGPGMNHLAIGAASQADVDATAAYLKEHNVELLFGTPRHRPEFAQSEDQTYYQVMFTTPDKVLLEVVYTGPK